MGHRNTSLRSLVQKKSHAIEIIYFDEFSRASRDDIDWLKLAALCKRLNIGLRGASDGFDIDGEDWDLKVNVYNLINRQETKNKRQRVRRGMLGAASENRMLGKPPFGYTRKVRRDKNGQPEQKSDGSPRHMRVFDPETRDIAYRMFDLAVNHGWTPHRLAKWSNDQQIEGWKGWTSDGIRKMLINPAYIGLVIWNRSRREQNWEDGAGKWEVVRNRWQQWEWCYEPGLALIPKAWHVELRKRYEKGRRSREASTGRQQKRTPTTLFTDTLVCGYCGSYLRLYRSGKYLFMHCPNGPEKRHSCALSSSKSLKIIEASLLNYLQMHLLTEGVLRDILVRANEYLKEEASRPREDLTELRQQKRSIERKIDKLVRLTEHEDDEEACRDYLGRVKQLRAEANELEKVLREKEEANAGPPPQLTLEYVQQHVEKMRDVLSQEIPAAALALRALTGPITITQAPRLNGKHGYDWLATFTPDLLRLLREVGDADCPDSATLGFLCRRIWTSADAVQLRLEKVPAYRQNADAVRQMHGKGASVSVIASAFGIAWNAADQWVRYATTGEAPHWQTSQAERRPAGRHEASVLSKKTPKYIRIAEEVARLRDEQHMTFIEIQNRVGAGAHTVRKAYDHVHRDAAWKTAEQGKAPSRGRYRRLDPEVRAKVLEMLKQGFSVTAIVHATGISASSVYRIRRAQEA